MKSTRARRSLLRQRLGLEFLEERRVMAYADVVLASQPLFLWQFNEPVGTTVAEDASPNNNDGTFNGAAARVTGRTGQPGDRALELLGAGTVSLNNATAVLQSITTNNEATVSFWQKNDPPTNPRNSTLFSGYDSGNARQFQTHLLWGDSTLYFDTAGGAAANSQRIQKTASAAEVAQIENQWNHWAFVKDGTRDTMAIYLNGQLWHSGNAATADMGTMVAFIIGAEFNGANPFFGRVDDFAVFNRAITPAEIQRMATSVDIIWDGGAGDGQWSNPINWVGDSNIPDSPNETATFDGAAAGSVTIGNNSYTIAGIDFRNATGSYAINAGTGSLAVNRIDQAGAGSNTVNAPLSMTGPSALLAAAGSTLTINGNVQLTSSVFTVDGAGTVAINGQLRDEVTGRFIRVQNDGTANRLLHLSEIEAFAPGVTPNPAGFDNANDFALTSKGASFESTNGTIAHATQGNNSPLDGDIENGADAWTYSGVNVNYVADLGQNRTLGQIRVWQRGDCCFERLADFSVEVLADNGAGLPGAVLARRSFVGQVPNSTFATLDFQVNAKLVKRGAGTLILSNSNSFAGGTEIHAGELRISNATGSATGSGSVRIGPAAPQVRFVDVMNLGTTSRLLHIGEIEAFPVGTTPAPTYDPANDVALASKGASIELTTGSGGHGQPGAVIDGMAQSGGDTWTRENIAHVEMMVDLGRNYDLSQVRVWQRADGCCQDRLSNFRLQLLADDGFGGPGVPLHTATFPGQAPTNSFASFAIPALPVAATTARLTGSGSIAGAVTVLAGSTFAPGVGPSGTGTITTGGLTLSVNSVAEAQIAAGGSDLAVVNGNVQVSGALPNIAVAAGFRPANQVGIVLIDNRGPNAVTGIFNGLPDGTQVALSGRLYEVSYNFNATTGAEGTGNDVALIPIDRAPTATITSAPNTITEGGAAITFTASGSDPDADALTFSWDLDGDGAFDDATGASITRTWAQLVALGIDDGPDTFNVRVRASDGELSGDSTPQTLTVTNAPPVASIDGPTTATPGQLLDFDFSAVDPSPADTTMTYLIDWGDGSTEEVTGPAAGETVSHTFGELGLQTITVQARDDDNGLSAPVTFELNVVAAAVDSEGRLHIGGTDSNDRIVVSISGGIRVRMNNRLLGPFSVNADPFAEDNIIIHGNDGSDTITISSNVFLNTMIFGGAGNDYITGGPRNDIIDGGDDNDRLLGGGGLDTLIGGDGNDSLSGGLGNDVLLGGEGRDSLRGDNGDDLLDGEAGNDTLAGGLGNDLLRGGDGIDTLTGDGGNDILVGGAGGDKLYGRAGSDLLIGGADFDLLYGAAGDDLLIGIETTSDDDDAALMAILLAWTTGGTQQSRIDALTAGALSDDDLIPSSTNMLFGEGGNDWFIAIFGDGVRDKKSTDILRVVS